MNPVEEKVGDESRVTSVTGESAAYRSREETTGAEDEREGRRAGIILIAVGCGLMSLAVGEASAATAIEGAWDAVLHASGWFLP